MRWCFAILALVLALILGSPTTAAQAVVVTDKAIVLRDPVTFETGKATIRAESFALLDAVAATLEADQRIAFVEIGVHTDTRGSAAWNRKISQARAEAIFQYLVGRGIDGKRLRARGYGESRPRDRGNHAAAQAKNRRTELLILQRTT